MTSAVLILPDAYRDAGNAFGVDQGWGENNFYVALSGDGSEPATHWGCRGDVTQGFVDMVTNPAPEHAGLAFVLLADFNDALSPYDHWTQTIADNGLKLVQATE